MSSTNINTEFLDDFPNKELKENYNWEIVSVSKDDTNKRSVFCGIKKNDDNDRIHAKQFKIYIDENFDEEIKEILREIYFLFILKQYDCFVKLNDILIDKEEDTKKINLILKGNTVTLKNFISSNYYIY